MTFGTSGNASPNATASDQSCRASTKMRSAPASRYAPTRSSALSRPSGARASDRAMSRTSWPPRPSTIAWTFSTISVRGMTRLPSMWPHFFGTTWSSMCSAATPAAAYSRTVRTTLSGPP